MGKIKNIIFDLGGIFIELDYIKTENAFINLGVSTFPQLYNQHYTTPLFTNLETGKIDEQEFYKAFRRVAIINLPHIAANRIVIGAVAGFHFFYVPVCVLQIFFW